MVGRSEGASIVGVSNITSYHIYKNYTYYKISSYHQKNSNGKKFDLAQSNIKPINNTCIKFKNLKWIQT